MSGQKATLMGNVGPDDTELHIEIRFRIDDEIMWLVRRTHFIEGSPPTDPSRWIVLRGQEGSIAAPHEAGAELMPWPE